MAAPERLELRAYNVGFGDCFLLSFVYAGNKRKHLLIDFGMKPKPPAAEDDFALQIASDIDRVTGGRLDAIVASHRHQDHISGFTTRKKEEDPEESGDVIRRIAKNALVVQPWTEDPEAPANATGGTQAFAKQLTSMHGFAEGVIQELGRLVPRPADTDASDPTQFASESGPKMRMGVQEGAADRGGWFAEGTLLLRLRDMALNALSNKPAIANLEKMGSDHDYLFFGKATKLEDVLPGVKVHVLGPPTIDQWKRVKRQTTEDPDEFWHLQHSFWSQQSVNLKHEERLFPEAKVCEPSRASEWFVRRLRGVRMKQLLELVKSMDSALNNTSLILLFEAGNKKLLFPGDAQIENWEYALKEAPNHEEILQLLAEVDVYKVGHHGSLNATPKTLWNNFAKKGAASNTKRMRSVISTMKEVHGETPQTAVPRTTLVNALKRNTKYRSTEGVQLEDRCFVEKIDL
jgi:hypothetical protein